MNIGGVAANESQLNPFLTSCFGKYASWFKKEKTGLLLLREKCGFQLLTMLGILSKINGTHCQKIALLTRSAKTWELRPMQGVIMTKLSRKKENARYPDLATRTRSRTDIVSGGRLSLSPEP